MMPAMLLNLPSSVAMGYEVTLETRTYVSHRTLPSQWVMKTRASLF